MKTNTGAKRRRRLAATAALLCALVASWVVTVAPAFAESGDSAPIRPLSEGGYNFPDITGPEGPEEYPMQMRALSPELKARQVNDREIAFEYFEYGVVSWTIKAEPAHDAVGATVPTTVSLSEDEEGPIVTEIVHYRAGNPAAGGAPFVFPIMGGTGWEGGFWTSSIELTDHDPPATEPPAASPAPTCTVPSLTGLSLHAAKARLRTADCAIGQVRLARGATRAKGKVVKQFRPAGTQLAAGAAVAVKLGAR